MKKNIACIILIALLGITVSVSIAQQNQNVPKTNTEVEALQKRVSEIESKLQTVENVEKMELAAKLAEAQAKLINTEFGKLKLELKDSNQQWLITWILIFLGILSIVGYALWSRLTKKMDDLIENEVEKSLNGFKESVDKVSMLEGQLKVLEKEHAASVLKICNDARFNWLEMHHEQIKALPEEVLLEVFSDKTRDLAIRLAAVKVLTVRNSPRLVSPVLNYLNSVVDTDFDWEEDFGTQHHMCDLVRHIGLIHTPEAYEGLKSFLDRLLTENPKDNRFVLTSTILSLVYVSSELKKRDSLSILRTALPYLHVLSRDENALKNLVEYFNKFQEHVGIKEILTNGLTGGIPDLEKQCLEILQEHDPDFVNEWKAQKATTNTESEES